MRPILTGLACGAVLLASPAAAQLSDPVRVMLEGAIESGNASEVDTVAKYAKTAFPEDADAIDAMVGGWKTKVAERKRAELEMVELVTKHLKSCKKIVDLFSGSGTFTFPLAQKSAVHAVETSGAALNSIDRGFRSRQGLKPISTERRDLFRSPFVREDLKPYQGVIFDPPRAGAEAQSKQLARALNIKKVAAVSCNPTSLARDLELLVKGGFKIKSITAIDQFLWSSHVEMVALLER